MCKVCFLKGWFENHLIHYWNDLQALM